MADELLEGAGTQPTQATVTEQTPEQIAAAAAAKAAAEAAKTPEQLAAEKAAADKAVADKAAADAAAAAKAAAAGVTEPVQTVATDGTVTFTPTGNIGMDLALEYFGKLGFKLEDAELDQAGKGNFTYLEAKLATLGDKAKGAERYVALAKQAQAEIAAKMNAGYEARRAVVYETVGGEEEWKKISAFAQANAEPEELAEIKTALQAGGKVARLMAQELQSLYLKSNPTRNAQSVTNGAQATAPAQGALSLTTYKQELNELVAKVGVTRLQDSAEYAQLRQRYAHINK